MDLERKLGAVRKFVWDGNNEGYFFSQGSKVNDNWFVLPVGIMLGRILGVAQVSSLHLTGVTLEMDVYHAGPVEFTGQCLLQDAADWDVGVESTERGGGKFSVGVGNGDLLGDATGVIRSAMNGVFEGTARDGTYFGASVAKSDRVVKPCDFRANKGRKLSDRTGRAAVELSKTASGASMADMFVKDTMRVY